jgi:hypothetical protein
MFLATNLAGWYSFTLEFDRMAALVSDPVMAHLPDQLASGIKSGQAFVAWLRGDLDDAVTLLTESRQLIADEDDPQLVFAREFAGINLLMLAGKFEEGFELAVELCSRGWNAIANGFDTMLLPMILLGDRQRIAPLRETIAAYASVMPDWTEFLQMVAETEPGAALPADRVEAVINRFDQNLLRYWAILALMAAAQFSPRPHPDRDRYLAEARRRCEERGLQGALDLINRYIG